MKKMHKISENQKIPYCISIHLGKAKCPPALEQKAFTARQGGFCLQVAETLVNEQETCRTGAVLLSLSERINLCLSLP